MRSKQYGPDVLWAGRRPARPEFPKVTVERGLVVEDAAAQFCGAVAGWEKDAVLLEDRHGKQRAFPFGPGAFLLEGVPVTLVRPGPGSGGSAGSGGLGGSGGSSGSGRSGSGPGTGVRSGRTGHQSPVRSGRTASGSVAASRGRAKVARASRIYVEGRHDAELVEKIWGDDLRDVGVVVEYLDGIDDLPAIVARFRPERGRRLGVLVDHLVDGSKESRIAAKIGSPHVLVVGHPFVDVWAAVKPARLGLDHWPEVPRGISWKDGVLAAIGWPADTAAAWQRILRSVRSFADLEPAFLGRVEELIDFVTEPGSY